MFRSEIRGNQVFVYYNESLIYKKWLNTSQPSKLFNVNWPTVDIQN